MRKQNQHCNTSLVCADLVVEMQLSHHEVQCFFDFVSSFGAAAHRTSPVNQTAGAAVASRSSDFVDAEV